MKVDITKAARLMKVVELGGVRLLESHAKSNMVADEEAEGIVADFNFRGGPTPQRSPDELIVHASIEILVRRVNSNEPLVTMSATYELQYGLPADIAPTSEELAAFAASNAIFNVWPYWREFVQSMFLKMGHPPLVLPVFRLENAGQRLKGFNPIPSIEDTPGAIVK